jgi:hypothetical protein
MRRDFDFSDVSEDSVCVRVSSFVEHLTSEVHNRHKIKDKLQANSGGKNTLMQKNKQTIALR